MNETVRLSSFGHVLSVIGAITAIAGASACGGSERSAPRTPAPKSAAPEPEPEAHVDLRASHERAQAAAQATTDGPWPFGPAQSSEDRSAQIDRLKKEPGPIKSNWVPPGKSERYGHAEGLVAAPVAAVRAKLHDFGRYKDLAGPKFKSVRVVDKQGQSTDVYFQLPIMKGMITIWYVTRFPPSRSAGVGDVLEGTFVKGNIKTMHIAFTVKPGPDDKSSVMVCDLYLRPTIPAPQWALDEELRDACGDAIRSVRRTLAMNP